MTTNQTQTIGFIGLGAMGMGMAQSLLRAGFTVNAYDINPASVQTFSEAGGNGVTSVAEAADGADVFIIVVVNAEQTEDVLFGSGGAAEKLSPGSVVMACSTVKPDFARETDRRLREMGIDMLDTPISGGPARAATGELSIMASGDPAVFAKVDSVLDAMAANLFRLGDEVGYGSTTKMVNQLLAGVHIAVAAEAMALGVKAGMDPEKLYETISSSAGSSWMFQNRVPHMLAGDFTPLSAVEIFVKDLGIVLEAGKELRFPLPLSAAAHQMYLMAASAGLGREDDSAVVKIFEQMAGIEVRGQGETGD
jgi:3-hydroxyisobutyrate dehydrogenase